MAELSKRIIRIPPHRSLNRADFRSKTVLVRLDLNVPMEEGAVSDTQRIDASMPTLKKIIETESIIPEPTSAATFAALYKLKVPTNSLVVAVNTGDGKKMMDEIRHLIKKE